MNESSVLRRSRGSNVQSQDKLSSESQEKRSVNQHDVEYFNYSKHPMFAERQLRQIYESNEFHNVELISALDNKRVKAIDFVLQDASDVIRELLKDTDPAQKKKVIVLDIVSGDILEQLVRFCYTGALIIDMNNVKDLLLAAVNLKMKAVDDACSDYIIEHCDDSNCLEFMEFAKAHSLQDLSLVCEDYIQQHFLSVTQEDEFLKLNYKSVGDILEYDNLNVNSEEEVYNVVAHWIDFDVEDRKDKLSYFLPKIKLPLMNLECLWKRVEPLCSADDHKLLAEAIKWQSMPCGDRKYLSKEQITPRPFSRDADSLRSSDSSSEFPSYAMYLKSNKCKLFSFETRQWLIVDNFRKIPFTLCKSAIVKNKNLVNVGVNAHGKIQIESINLRTMASTVLDEHVRYNQNSKILIDHGNVYFVDDTEINSFSLVDQVWARPIPIKLDFAIILAVIFKWQMYILGPRHYIGDYIPYAIVNLGTRSVNQFQGMKSLFPYYNTILPQSALVIEPHIYFLELKSNKSKEKNVICFNPELDMCKKWASIDFHVSGLVNARTEVMLFDSKSHHFFKYDELKKTWQKFASEEDIQHVKEFPNFSSLHLYEKLH